MVNHVLATAEAEKSVDHAGAVVDRPGGQVAIADDRLGLKLGQDGEEAVEVVAGHLPEHGLLKAGQVARLMARLGVEKIDLLDCAQRAATDEFGGSEIVAEIAHLLAHSQLDIAVGGQVHQRLGVGEVVAERLGDQRRESGAQRGFCLRVMPLRGTVYQRGIGAGFGQGTVEVAVERRIGQGQVGAGLLQRVGVHIDDGGHFVPAFLRQYAQH